MSPQIAPIGTGYRTLRELTARTEATSSPLPPSPTPAAAPRIAQELNSMSETVLTTLGRWGGVLEEYGFGRSVEKSPLTVARDTVAKPYEHVGLADTVLRKSSEGLLQGRAVQNTLQRSLGNPHLVVDATTPASVGLRVVGPVARAVSGVLDSVTGVGNVLVALHRDQEQGDTSYRGTVRESLLSTLQISAGGLAGAAAGTVAGIIGFGAGTLAAPVVIGVGVGIAASYAAGRITDYIRSVW